MNKYAILMAIAASVFAIASCDKYEDGKPSSSVLDRFEAMYPGAWDVEWEREGVYWEVSFDTGSYPNEIDNTAWFTNDGTWVRTETDLYIGSVPAAIKEFLQNSEYASALLEDTEIDYIQTPDGNYYQFELIYNGAKIKVNVTEDGKISLAGFDIW